MARPGQLRPADHGFCFGAARCALALRLAQLAVVSARARGRARREEDVGHRNEFTLFVH